MGKIELDHTGSGAGITLSSDGTDLLLDGTAIGGGGGTALELYAENYVSGTLPSATGIDAFVIGRNSAASGERSVALGAYSTASGSYSLAINGSTASATNSAGILGSATQNGATAIGSNSGLLIAQAAGQGAMALGGSRASGTDSFAAAIANNTSSYGATGANSVAIGQLAKAGGTNGISFGRLGSASASKSIAIGDSLFSSGTSSITLGTNNSAASDYGCAIGYFSHTKDTIGKMVYASGRFSGTGDAQTGTFVLRSDTTDATPEALTANNSTAGTTNQVILPNNSAYAFHGTIVARQQASAGTACAAWKIEGLIRREGSAGTTVLVNSATTVLDNTPAWGMALSADTTNGGLKIEVTGAAATNIRWVATINTSEVTY